MDDNRLFLDRIPDELREINEGATRMRGLSAATTTSAIAELSRSEI